MKKVMYIGKKPTKRDTPNNEPNRVWRGLGDVQDVSDAECHKLTQAAYKTIWLDVTSLSEAARSAIVEDLRECFRAEARAVTPAGDVARALGTLSTDELKAELRRRGTDDGKAESNLPPKPTVPLSQGGRVGEKEVVQRPPTTDAVVEEIAGAIMGLDKENKAHYDDKGNPVLEAVKEKLGYEISNSELGAAVKLIKGAK